MAELQTLQRMALMAPNTWNEETRSATIVISTDADVGDGFVLRHTKEAIRWPSRPLPTDYDHKRTSESIWGAVTDLTLQRSPEGGNELIGTVVVDGPPDAMAIALPRLRTGSARFSVDARIYAAPYDKQRDLMDATDWEPVLVSLVPIGQDQHAVMRSDKSINSAVDSPMSDELKAGGDPATVIEAQRAADPNPQPEPVPAADAELQRTAAELRRERDILRLSQAAGLTAEQTDELVRSNKTVHEASIEAVRLLRIASEGGDIRKGEVPALGHPARIAVTRDSGDTLVRAFGDEMERRVGLVKQPTEVGRQVLGYTMLEMCRMYLESRGVNTAGMSKNDLVSRGFHSTSDFPLLLENVSSKTLLAAYAEEPQTWKPLAVQRNLPDFKQVSDYQISGQVIPELTLEGGEYRTGTLVEGKSTWNLSTFTKKLTFTRQLIINDDLEAFQRTTNILGRGCNLLESNLAWDLITTGSDGATVSLTGNPLFHSTHNNKATGAGTDISIEGMDAAKLKLRNQKDIAGNRINLAPAYLVVPTTLETRSLQFLFPTGYAPAQLTGNSGPNPFASGVQLIVEPRLDDDSTSKWYLTSSPNRVEMMTYGYLAGEPGPTITTTEKRDPDGVEMLVRMDFGITLSDFRGFVRADGTAPGG